MGVKQRPAPRAYRPRPNRPEQILAAACRAIQQRGFANARIGDIAAEVDGLGFELLLGYSWTSPERMRKRLYGFAAEELVIESRALERDAQTVIALLDGDGG
jgi:hypothetical protein